MHSKVFKLTKPMDIEGDQFLGQKAYFWVPTLEAYALEYAELRIYQSIEGSGKTNLLQGEGFDIEGRKVRWDNYIQPVPGLNPPIYLVIHYHGILDYAKLFPVIRGVEQAARLGMYYEEAEKNYESTAWLSFLLMCGAIFEGMLYDILNEELTEEGFRKKRGFSNYINDAYEAGLITDEEKEIMYNTKEQRNLVHLGRYKEPYVSRELAMNTRKILDDMIIRFSTIV